MEIATVVEIISTIGFPITAVIVMGWFIFTIYKRSEVREDSLREEIKENRKINSKFAKIISKYEIQFTEITEDIKEIKEDVLVISKKIGW